MNEPQWLALARTYEGLEEIPGGRHEAEIVQFFADVGHAWVKDDETAWCAAYAGAMLERTGIRSTRALDARSYMGFGTGLGKPRLGCIAVFWRGSPDGWQGHVGFYISETKTHVKVIGGNQGNKVGIDSYSKKQLLGYRWPAAGAKAGEAHAATGPDDKTIRHVQERLKALGYHEVGLVDGLWGSRTRGAVKAFRDDQDIETAGKTAAELIDDALLGALARADKRPVSPQRAASEPANSRIVKSQKRQLGVAGAGALAGTLAALRPVVEEATAFGQALGPVFDLVGTFWPYLLVIGCGVAAYLAWQAWGARVEDHQEGKTA